jgi:hypothetical protein
MNIIPKIKTKLKNINKLNIFVNVVEIIQHHIKASHFKTNKHKQYEERTTNNITNNYNITNLIINSK